MGRVRFLRRIALPLSILLIILFMHVPVMAVTHTFETVDYPEAYDTEANAINKHGQIVGTYYGETICIPNPSGGEDFCAVSRFGFLKNKSIFSTIEYPGTPVIAPWTEVWGVNASGQVVGTYWNESGWNGFLKDGDSFTSIEYGGASNTQCFGINDDGQIVGFYNTGVWHGFLKKGQAFITIDYPGALWTIARGINNSGQIVGTYGDGTTNHGFLKRGATFMTIDYPETNEEFFTEVSGINDSGQIVGNYCNVSTCHGFLKDGETFISIDYPGAAWTQARGINKDGQIVGSCGIGATTHGFLAKPQK